jgi:quinoprotein glucose dehydrogenase
MLLLPPLVAAVASAQTVEWPSYGNDPGGTRFSVAKTITKFNVATLNRAWEYKTGALDRAGRQKGKIAFEATPIFVNGTLYLSTPLNRVIALDPESGKERWSYDPEVSLATDYSEVTSRGVSYWAAGKRIFTGTIDARLIALDAATGKKCTEFGKGGEVDLRDGIRIRDAGNYQITSPPAVVKDLVIVGSSVGDNRATDIERGTVRAYDARTGKLRWSWDPLASLPSTGGANAWSILSADAKLGLVFVPTGSAGPDFFGGERKGDNRYANSVTALRAATGEVAWSFQVVHHDLWDYDVASQPILIEYGAKKRRRRLRSLSRRRWGWCMSLTARLGSRCLLSKSVLFQRVTCLEKRRGRRSRSPLRSSLLRQAPPNRMAGLRRIGRGAKDS